ncbi:SDR family NAD(P)-dependent oxidoreductase [Microbacterium indicum]|uniref:SDR family NAD(P)-dependent oxidoreductase n=1 Tax=Microbacterium indicum TaxID=358100 RepID=UPI0003F6DDD5|nr:SDR family NAD(P)-dependent oxidoreductase [Microbacterium indicum]
MNITARTAFIAGGTTGIGAALAARLREAGSTVIVGGRAAEGDGRVRIDVTDPLSIARARDAILLAHPDLDLVVTMAGIMPIEDLRDPAHAAEAERAVEINLLGTMRVVDAFMPHLLARGSGDIVTVSSGIGFLPFPPMPSYGATKAGVHAYSEALRAQLAGTGIGVTELVPPAVANAGQERINPAALPMGEFLDEVIGLIVREPTPNEVVVEAAQHLRWAERDGSYAEQLERRSAALATLLAR